MEDNSNNTTHGPVPGAVLETTFEDTLKPVGNAPACKRHDGKPSRLLASGQCIRCLANNQRRVYVPVEDFADYRARREMGEF